MLQALPISRRAPGLFPRPVRFFLALLVAFGSLAAGAGLAAADAEAQKKVLEQTSTVRELPVLAEVPLEFVEPAQLRADLQAAEQTPEASEELETGRKVLVLLGMLPADYDLDASLRELYGEAIAGYYSPKQKKMFIVGSGEFGLDARMTLAHEFTHALQDQHFDLQKMREPVKDLNDRSMALTSLVEGDATLATVVYFQRFTSAAERQAYLSGRGSQGPNPFANVPVVLRESILFPYRSGLDFALALFRAGGMQRINEAFRDPPQSTEQVLHPERYFQRDEPAAVELPDLAAALGEGWSQREGDTLGELDFRNLLQTFLDDRIAANGAAGWGGDQYSYLEGPDGAQAFASVSLWDDEAQAREFFELYLPVVARRFGDSTPLRVNQETVKVWQTPVGLHALHHIGNRVLLLYAPDEAALGKITSALTAPAPASARQS